MAVLKYAVCVAVHAVISVAAYNPLNPPQQLSLVIFSPCSLHSKKKWTWSCTWALKCYPPNTDECQIPPGR